MLSMERPWREAASHRARSSFSLLLGVEKGQMLDDIARPQSFLAEDLVYRRF